MDMFRALKDLLQLMNEPGCGDIGGRETPTLEEQLNILHSLRHLSRSPVLP